MHIIIPVKRFAISKTRLAGLLAPWQRSALAGAMAEDVLGQLQLLRGISGVLVVSSEPSLADLKSQYKFDLLPEIAQCRSLNDAVQYAMSHLEQRGHIRAMVLHGDLPLVDRSELQHLVDQHTHSAGPNDIVLVPDRSNQGTNAMICSLPCRIALQYGTNSFQRHRANARATGLTVAVERLPLLSIDIDYPVDLLHIQPLSRSNTGPTRKSLQQINLWAPLIGRPPAFFNIINVEANNTVAEGADGVGPVPFP